MNEAMPEQALLTRDWNLTASEARIILAMRDSPHQYISYHQVHRLVSTRSQYTSANSPTVAICKLRKKLAGREISITTIREAGYSLDAKFFPLIDAVIGRRALQEAV